MPYMLAPGARLYVGPHGQMEESLGACCPSCATSGGSCATGLGATKSAAVVQAGLMTRVVNTATLASVAEAAHRRKLLLLGVGVGGAALAGLLILRRLRKGKR